MKKTLLSISIIFIFQGFLYSQSSYQWGTTLKDGGFSGEAKSIALDQKGNSYVTGYFSGQVDFGNGKTLSSVTDSADIFVAKYDPKGGCIWAFSMGYDVADAGTAIYLDPSDDVYLTGYYSGKVSFDPQSTAGNLISDKFGNAFIAKYTSDGKFNWVRNIGGDGHDVANCVSADKSGVYVSGSFNGSAIDLDMPNGKIFENKFRGTKDIFIVKYGLTGKYVWGGTAGDADEDEAKTIYSDQQGSVYVGGYFNKSTNFDFISGKALLTSQGVGDGFIAGYDAINGSNLNAFQIGGREEDAVSSLSTDTKGNIYATGNFSSTAAFDGSIKLDSKGGKDIFLVKYDVSGKCMYAYGFGGLQNDEGNGVSVTPSGSIYLTGNFAGDVCFDPNLKDGYMTTFKSTPNVFMSRYQADGTFYWAASVTGDVRGSGSALVADGSGKLYVAGYAGGAGFLDPGIDKNPYDADAKGDILIGLYDTRRPQTLSQTPNPIPSKTFGDPAFTLSVTASSGLPVTLSNLSTSVIGITGNNITIKTGGSATIFAFQDGDEDYFPVSTTISFVIKRAPQTLIFPTLPTSKTFGDAPFKVSAYTNKGLPVILSSKNTAFATVLDSTITIKGAGSVIISAFSAGNLNYDSVRVNQTLNIAKAPQTITFTPLVNKKYGDLPFALPVTTSSNLSINYTISPVTTPPVVSITNNILTINGMGTVTITANQSGNSNYLPASSVSRTLIIETPDTKIAGREIVSENITQEYSVVPVLTGYKYVWSSDDKDVIIYDTTTSKALVTFTTLSSRNSTLTCKVYDSNNNPKDTVILPIAINKSANITLPPPVCAQIDSFQACAGSYLDYFNLESLLNKNSGCSQTGYGDYTQSEIVTKLFLGDVYSAKVRVGYNGSGTPPFYVGTWIDYNNNSSFEDAGEFLSSFYGTDSIIELTNMTVSNNEAFEGGRRLRIRVRTSGSFTSSEGCTQVGETGETEDYLVILSKHARLEAPQIITPNGDGMNDFFVVRGIDPSEANKLVIFDRMGQVLHKEENYANTWSGKDSGGKSVSPGTYYYTFSNGDKSLKGFFQLIY
jgi:gliding motility-associated-like protein